MSYTVTRLTLYAVLTALEEDLRALFRVHLADQGTIEDLLGREIWEKARGRLQKDRGAIEAVASLAETLLFVDLGDTLQLLNSHKASFPPNIGQYLGNIAPRLQKLIPVRNRVMHGRPLHFDDLPVCKDTARYLLAGRVLRWENLNTLLARLEEDPSFILGLSITPSDPDSSRQRHNLPLPDFDETGFIGRKRQLEQLTQLCLGVYPVITVVGDGGLGKSALVLKTAYDMLDLPDCPFEAMVWTSSKTSQLTPNEIIEIKGAIRDSLGMLESVAHQLSGVAVPDAMEEVLAYLEEFRVLLIIDNLETIMDARVFAFLERLPRGSKILITSRIGLGKFEFPLKLEEMEQSDSIQLLRALAETRGVQRLLRMPNATLGKYCDRMRNNPGYIKWFVCAVQAGRRPEEVLANPGVFLDFCMSNVYNYLSEASRRLLTCFLSVPARHTQAELAYLNQSEVPELQRTLQELLRTNMVFMTSIQKGSSFESQYTLSELARQYLLEHHPASSEDLKAFSKRHRQLVAAGEQVRAQIQDDPYSTFSLAIKTRGDLAVARLLLEALGLIESKQFLRADKLIAKAKDLAPDYFEVYRVAALLGAASGNLATAQRAYAAAVELEGSSAPLRLWYGQFLMLELDDLEGALLQLKEAERIDGNAFDIQRALARAYLYLKRFEDARALLEALSKRADASVWNQRKLWDLKLQYCQRHADHVMRQHDEAAALESLGELRECFEKCPPHLIDNRMREKLKKALLTATDVVRFTQGERKADAMELARWIAKEAGLTRDEMRRVGLFERWSGEIVRVRTDVGFGFVLLEDGEELYFNFKEALNPNDRVYFRRGQRVMFGIGENREGRCAIDITIERGKAAEA